MPDTYFAVACVVLLAALICMCVVAANEIRRLKTAAIDNWGAYARALNDARRWREAYNDKAAQAEAYLGQLSAPHHSQDYQGPSYVDAALARNGSGS
jgi:hypothetical protein